MPGAMRRGQTYIHFPSTSGEVEEQRHLQLTEGFQVFSKPFPGELFQSVLVALGSLFHFTFLIEGEQVRTHPWVCFSAENSLTSPMNGLGGSRLFLERKARMFDRGTIWAGRAGALCQLS